MIKTLYNKYKEYILYIIFGGLTTVVNYVVYFLFTRLVHSDISISDGGTFLKLLARLFTSDTIIANTVAWVAAVAFAYVVNRKWVFESKSKGFAPILAEIFSFAGGRLFTLILENVMLWIFVEKLGINDILIKLVASVLTIILNYIFGKFIVFRKEKNKEPALEENSETGSETALKNDSEDE